MGVKMFYDILLLYKLLLLLLPFVFREQIVTVDASLAEENESVVAAKSQLAEITQKCDEIVATEVSQPRHPHKPRII